MTRLSNLISVVGFSLVFLCCSSVPRICEPESARSAGIGLAMQGHEISYGVGEPCLDESRASFRQYFEKGYQYAQNLKRQGQGLGGGLVSQDYECKTEITNRSGTIDISRCGNASGGRIACYQDRRETCRHRTTGATQVKNAQSFDGRCVSSFSSCW